MSTPTLKDCIKAKADQYASKGSSRFAAILRSKLKLSDAELVQYFATCHAGWSNGVHSTLAASGHARGNLRVYPIKDSGNAFVYDKHGSFKLVSIQEARRLWAAEEA